MANNITQYNATAGSNTTIDSISIDEGMAASNVNNAIRSLMSHLKNVDTGTQALTALSVTGNVSVGGTFTSRGIDDNADALAITISSGENVGIGVVPETTWNSNIDALQLGLGASIYGDNTATGLQISANAVATLGSSLNGYKYINSDKASTYQQYDGEHNFRVASSGSADGAITWSTAMTINNTGAVTKPQQPAFQAHPSSTQTNLANGTTIAFGTERFDNNGNFASNTFTAPVTGKYQINANVSLVDVDSSANFVGILVLSSNRAYYAYHGTGGFDSDVSFLEMSVNQLIDMDANDTVYVIFHQNGGTQQTDIHEDLTNFSGYLVA